MATKPYTKKPPPSKPPQADSPTFVNLKTDLAITPKTTHLLLSLGYTDYRLLAAVSPNTLLSELASTPGLRDKPKWVDGYRRAVRRMVWLGTQDDPVTTAKNCSDWSIKGLTRRGWWCEGFDDLTGYEIEKRFGGSAEVKKEEEED